MFFGHFVIGNGQLAIGNWKNVIDNLQFDRMECLDFLDRLGVVGYGCVSLGLVWLGVIGYGWV